MPPGAWKRHAASAAHGSFAGWLRPGRRRRLLRIVAFSALGTPRFGPCRRSVPQSSTFAGRSLRGSSCRFWLCFLRARGLPRCHAACFRGDRFPQRIHEIDNGRRLLRPRGFDGPAGLFRADHLDQGVLVAIFELGDVEVAHLRLDDVLGEAQHLSRISMSGISSK